MSAERPSSQRTSVAGGLRSIAPADDLPVVLVVDDYVDNRELVCELLMSQGLRVIEARSGLEALDRARTFRPQVVLMDLALPGVDGWEATRRLLADPRTQRARVIAVTAHAQQEAIDRARHAGCVATIVKPFDPEELLSEVRRALAAARTDAAPREPQAERASSSSGRLTVQRTGYTASGRLRRSSDAGEVGGGAGGPDRREPG